MSIFTIYRPLAHSQLHCDRCSYRPSLFVKKNNKKSHDRSMRRVAPHGRKMPNTRQAVVHSMIGHAYAQKSAQKEQVEARQVVREALKGQG